MSDTVYMAVGLPVGGMAPGHGIVEMENRLIKFPYDIYRFWLQGFSMPNKSSFTEQSKSIAEDMLGNGFFIECNDRDGYDVFNSISGLSLYRQGIQKEVTDDNVVFAIGDGVISTPKNDIFLHIWQSCNGDKAINIYDRYFNPNMPKEFYGGGVAFLYAHGLLRLNSFVT